MKMSINLLEDNKKSNYSIIEIKGEISEAVDFKTALNFKLQKTIVVKCPDITKINSTGVKRWISFFQDLSKNNPDLKSVIFMISNKEVIKNSILEYGNYIDGYFIRGEFEEKSKMIVLLCSLLNKPLSEYYANSTEITLNMSAEKNIVLTNIEECLAGFSNVNPRLKHFIINTLDELLLNAIYDAPFEIASKKNIYKNMPRNTTFIFEKPIKLSIVLGNDFLMFSILDEYGSFDHETLTRSLMKNPMQEYKEIDDSISQGAGLGIPLTFNKGASLVFSGEENKWTRTIAYFPLSCNFKDFKNTEKFLINFLWKK